MTSSICFTHKRPSPQLQLIPLINIIFLLLFFFLVTGRIDHLEPIAVTLPKSQQGEQHPKQYTTIFIQTDNQITINHDKVLPEDLSTIFEALLFNNPNEHFIVKADSRTPAATFVTLMRHAKEAGVSQIDLMTEQ